MKISVRDLRAISDRLWDHLEAEGHSEIELVHDFYWYIPDNALYDLNQPPIDHTVGQLYDDWYFLQELLDPDWEPLTGEMLHLAAIMREIGMQIVT